MSKKLIKAANERDQKSILKYAKATEEECRTQGEGLHDISVLTSTERGIELKDATPTPKRKRSQESSPNNSESSRPPKFINMSKTPEEKASAVNQTTLLHDSELDDDELTLNPELAKLERILSRK